MPSTWLSPVTANQTSAASPATMPAPTARAGGRRAATPRTTPGKSCVMPL